MLLQAAIHDPGEDVTPSTPRTCAIALATLSVLGLAACSDSVEDTPPAPIVPVQEAKAAAVDFRDVSATAGLDFRHANGAVGDKWMPETMGGGVVILDFDNDGRNDILLVSSTTWPGPASASIAESPSSLALFRNDGNGEDGVPRFSNVSRQAGLERALYAMGGTSGDFDNDGWTDLYVTGLSAYGGNRLLRNDHGRFLDVTADAGIDVPGWGTSAAFFDYDADGKLDLFVARYVEWSPDADLFCALDGSNKSYCTPERYSETSSRLFHNLGDGRFEDVSEASNIASARAKALGVAPWDYNGDGRVDLAVSNDTTPNNLFRNEGDGTFTDVALESGIAVDEAGRSRGAMGIDWADAFAGGSTLAIGNFSNEAKSFYWTEVGDVFLDRSMSAGVARSSFLDLTFGVFFFDYDFDGHPDLLFCNGHVENSVQEVQKQVSFRQAPALYWNNGDGLMSNASAQVGTDFAAPLVCRGSAYADLDGDGDLDIVLVENDGPAHLYLNELENPADKVVRIEFAGDGVSVNRSAFGTRVMATINGKARTEQVRSARSYVSASEPAVSFGLGDSEAIERIEVTWPDGSKQQASNLAPGRYRWVIRQAPLRDGP
ncbi:CRTAC1 family protein [Dokdonella sp.]|uniref:CRTAC1 family protein n=1 Tax=Dokdonella sp. TaxID=2291710 RepID=UPI003527BBAE